MSEEKKDSEGIAEGLACKAIVAMTSVALYIMFFQLDIISAQVLLAFKIPVQTTTIYIEKIYGLRFLTFSLGTIIVYIIYAIYENIKPDMDHHHTRVTIKKTSFVVMLIGRVILLLVSCFSSNIPYHVYLALTFESFGLGAAATYNIATVPQHSTVVIMSAHLSRLVTFLAQLLLDFVYRDNPLPKVRFQFLLCSTLNAIAVGCLFYYHDKSPCEIRNTPDNPEPKENGDGNTSTQDTSGGGHGGSNGGGEVSKKESERWSFGTTFSKVASPFFMYSAGSTLFDTVHPGVIPYALLPTKKCHLINMMSPIANLTGPLTLFALETAGLYNDWNSSFNAGWLFTIPMIIISVYSILAVHTRIPSARIIINNRPRVLAMTFSGALGNSFMDPLSFSGVAKILFVPKGHIPDLGVLLLHELFCMVVRYFNDKLSVGYNVVRTSLGYVFPKFRPNHRMSKWNTFWYVLKQTFRKAIRDARSDLNLDVKKYL
ncbi:hypothetical protein TOT_040000016 [Theileria orientalis strain Shintoku]|uniref:Uncharacterized protein n=1 Tax=Theileria orientalis strain Shintoku TaxID=869250 RepID=J4D9W2_THEOR|nr:hypothetical protein TOT_040000016 [Theileria orientalis strain Shintoku]BAM41635.1 hypothetical protein TOT_040000016 [Theileria orientalis strain Shintoku]|eukprot:XP_009691936.1 hypothetical protein TOT_040000016 [Theileria orientalis strain Shintoku]